MGDRALVMFCTQETQQVEGPLEFSPVTYLHWHGHCVGSLLGQLYQRMDGRRGDCAYVSARFVGLCHEMIEGNLSLGLWNAPDPDDLFERKKRDGWGNGWVYSHGDAGIFIVDCAFKQVVIFGGYGFKDANPTGDRVTVPWEKVPTA